MTYSCVDFVDSIIESLGVTIPDEAKDSPATQSDICQNAIEQLQRQTTPQPIATAPRNRRILAWMWDAWRVAKWSNDVISQKPRPFWNCEELSIGTSRANQPNWWVELPPAPKEGT